MDAKSFKIDVSKPIPENLGSRLSLIFHSR